MAMVPFVPRQVDSKPLQQRSSHRKGGWGPRGVLSAAAGTQLWSLGGCNEKWDMGRALNRAICAAVHLVETWNQMLGTQGRVFPELVFNFPLGISPLGIEGKWVLSK